MRRSTRRAAGAVAPVLSGWFLVQLGWQLTVIFAVLSWKVAKIMLWVLLGLWALVFLAVKVSAPYVKAGVVWLARKVRRP